MISEFGSMMLWLSFPFIIIMIIATCGEDLLDFLSGIFDNMSESRDKKRSRRDRKRKEKRAYKENMMRCKVALKKLELIEKGKDVSTI